MDVTSPITITLSHDRNKSNWGLRRFKPGEILKLKVLELNGDRALIDFGNFRATADIKIPVTLGENLQVKVIESDKQLIMSVIKHGLETPLSKNQGAHEVIRINDDFLKKIQAGFRQITEQTTQIQTGKKELSIFINVLNRLSSYFEDFNLRKNSANLIPQLTTYLENSGFFLEKRLENVISHFLENENALSNTELIDLPDLKRIMGHDLKANLLRLHHMIENKEILQQVVDPKVISLLTRLIEPLLADIATQQGRAIHQLESPEPFQIFTFTLPLRQDEQAARLKVYYQKKHPEGSKDGYLISLLLNMDRLGDVRTDFFLLDKELTITFYVQEKTAKREIDQHYHSLKEVLNNFFDQVVMNVVVSESKVLNFDREDMQLDTEKRVDLRV
ncbi:MAG: hypothetical protein PVI77_11265 [Desulfobacterales bacterium]|jgi:hypothetical protein